LLFHLFFLIFKPDVEHCWSMLKHVQHVVQAFWCSECGVQNSWNRFENLTNLVLDIECLRQFAASLPTILVEQAPKLTLLSGFTWPISLIVLALSFGLTLMVWDSV
jgi:hypothetical protein